MNDRNRLGVVYAYYEINGGWNKDALKERASARRCVARGSHIKHQVTARSHALPRLHSFLTSFAHLRGAIIVIYARFSLDSHERELSIRQSRCLKLSLACSLVPHQEHHDAAFTDFEEPGRPNPSKNVSTAHAQRYEMNADSG
jgi:hypothetical protein